MVYVIQFAESQPPVNKPVLHIPLLCVPCKIPVDCQKNSPKHIEFYSKNKFEKLVHLIGFIMKNFNDARSAECQIIILSSESLQCYSLRYELLKW